MNQHWLATWLGALTGLLLLPAASAHPARVILLRHAEKPADESSPHLSEQGRQRAEALAHWLTTNPALTNGGAPSVLFASQATDHGHGQRARETLEPAAREAGLPVRTPFRSEDYRALAREVLDSKAYEGKVVVICWVHEHLSGLAAALGVKPAPTAWIGSVYDRAWVLDWKTNQPTLSVVFQQLLPGDHNR
jgi:phosphohistidine phosphatase SixA